MIYNSPYSPLKIFHHKRWIKSIRAGKQPPPIFVQIIPTNRCNQCCTHCAYRTHGYSSNQLFNVQDELSIEKLKEVIASCRNLGVKAIELTGGGEPLLHPDFLELCTVILENEIDLGLVTNGSLWTSEHTEILSGAKWIRFSLDASNEHTYAVTRHTSKASYRNAIEAVKDITSVHNAPLVGISFVVTNDNWSELEEAADNAFEYGASYFRISAVFQNEGADYFRVFEHSVRESCANIIRKYANQRFKIFNLFGDRLNDLFQKRPDYSFCGFQQACTYIGADYNVYRCCVLSYNEKGFLGSIKDQSFSSMWKSEEKEKAIATFNAKSCERCMFNNKNETILYAIEQNPLHVNFV